MVYAHLILLFFIYACLGWCCEVAYAALKEGQFVNRGFLNGPICPIYGFGVIGVVLALRPVAEDWRLLYLGSAAFTTLIEFITGWALEKLFHARWWDYSSAPLNIMGYVCLPFSLLWGFACVAIVRWVHPMFSRAVALLPLWLCVALDALFGATFLLDLSATVVAVRRLSDRLARLTEAAGELHAISDELGQTIFDTTHTARERVLEGAEAAQSRRESALDSLETLQQRISGWLSRQKDQANARTEGIRARFEASRSAFRHVLEENSFAHRRLLRAFPNLKSHRHQEALERLRQFYQKHRPRRK